MLSGILGEFSVRFYVIVRSIVNYYGSLRSLCEMIVFNDCMLNNVSHLVQPPEEHMESIGDTSLFIDAHNASPHYVISKIPLRH